jgi:hypothetical protein
MPAAAPRTRKPASSSAPSGPKAGRTSIAAASRVRVPPRTIVHGTAGPAIKLTNPAAAKDPRFQKVMDRLQTSAAKSKDHVHPRRRAAEAMAAAKPSPKDKEKVGDAQANQVDTMKEAEKEAETKKPEKNSFLELLREKIKDVMPKTFGDAEEFMQGEKRAQLKGAATGNINQQKEEATSGMKSATEQPPDTSKVESNEGTPIPPEGPPPAPSSVGAADAVPAPKPESEVSLEKSKDEANQQMAQANVTPQQLQEANDPRFSAVLAAKSAVDKQATAAPQEYRANEQKILTQEVAKAVADEQKGLAAFRGEHNKADVAIKLRQQSTKEKDEADRKKVADEIERIYNKTQKTVNEKLGSLETDVSTMFDQGIEAAMKRMTDQVNTDMDRYKEKRYKGLRGKVRKVEDWLTDLPKETNVFYEKGRETFKKDLEALVVRIADVVETRLKEAKDEISEGQKRISEFVNGLPTNLQEVGKAAEQEMAHRFDELREGVDDKKNDLAQKLAQRYKEASDKADEKLKEIKEENKSRFVRFKEKLEDAYEILIEFKDRIMDILKKGWDTIMLIVRHPIRFLENLIDAIKQGTEQFANAGMTYLEEGVMKWLSGELGKEGIELSQGTSFGAIVLQVLGLTPEHIRAHAIDHFGESIVKKLETAADFFKTLFRDGLAALWEKLQEFLGNAKERVVNAILEWTVTSVIKAAIAKLAKMFIPAAAIIEAIKSIYHTVMFFIERRDQIVAFVERIIDSVHDIATGDVSSAAKGITRALVDSIPLIISFLVGQFGPSGIVGTIKGIIREIRDDVDKAIDLLIEKIMSGAGKLIGKGKEKETDKDKPSDVRQQALNALIQELRTDHTREQAQTIIKGVGERLKPMGLKSLELGSPSEDGKFPIYAEASAKLPLAHLKRELRAPKGRAVRTVAELTMKVPEPIYPQSILSDPDVKQPRIRIAGRVLKQENQRKVKVGTWNIGNEEEFNRSNDNSTHAEHHFVLWMHDQGEDFMYNTEKIILNNFDLSPCTMCAVELIKLTSELYKKGNLKEAELSWTRLYTGKAGPTTWDTVDSLQRGGWSLHAPKNEQPQGSEYVHFIW